MCVVEFVVRLSLLLVVSVGCWLLFVLLLLVCVVCVVVCVCCCCCSCLVCVCFLPLLGFFLFTFIGVV